MSGRWAAAFLMLAAAACGPGDGGGDGGGTPVDLGAVADGGPGGDGGKPDGGGGRSRFWLSSGGGSGVAGARRLGLSFGGSPIAGRSDGGSGAVVFGNLCAGSRQ